MKGNRTESQLSAKTARDFPSSPVVKTSNVGGASSIPGQGAKIPTCLVAPKPKIKHKTEAVLSQIQ